MEKMEVLRLILGFAGTVSIVGVAGWVVTTWLRVRHGYPLDGQDGMAVYPGRGDEAAGTVARLVQENTALRDELGAIKGRLATVERIVTDAPLRLANDIDALRDRKAEEILA